MIILVRHGEASHHTENLTGGWTDSELTIKGQEQIKRLAAKLRQDFIGKNRKLRILSSDLKRAMASATIIAQALSCEVEPMAFLREKNNGLAAGLTEVEAQKLYEAPCTLKEIDHRNYPHGETRREFFQRVVIGLQTIDRFCEDDFVIVAHKGTIQNIIFAWLGIDIAEVNTFNFSVDILPASLTVLGVNKWQEHTIFLLNETAHLHENDGFGILQYKYARNGH